MNGNATITGNLPTLKADSVTPATPADCTGINIYRAAGTAAPTKIGPAVISGATFSYSDTGLAPGPYNYYSTDLNVAGEESPLSNSFPAIVPAPPQLLEPPTIINVVIS